jgi:hypothetical protein
MGGCGLNMSLQRCLTCPQAADLLHDRGERGQRYGDPVQGREIDLEVVNFGRRAIDGVLQRYKLLIEAELGFFDAPHLSTERSDAKLNPATEFL